MVSAKGRSALSLLSSAPFALLITIGSVMPAIAVTPARPPPICSPDLDFALNSAALSALDQGHLDDFVAHCLATAKTVVVMGYADDSESPAMARARAEAARKYLVAKGISPTSVRLLTFENRPAPNKRAEVRAN